MSLQKKYLEIVALLAPVGAVGAPLVFGSATLAGESEDAVSIERPAIPSERVSERLAAIRDAVSAVEAAGQPNATTPPYRLAQAVAPFLQGPHWNNAFRPGASPNWGNWGNYGQWGNGWNNCHLHTVWVWGPVYPIRTLRC